MLLSPNPLAHRRVLSLLIVCAFSAALAGIRGSQPVADASTSLETTVVPGALTALAPVAGTLTVNTATDVADTNIGDGNCDTDGNLGNGDQCTLRAAIQEGNVGGGGYTINFNLPAGTVISLNTVLPGFFGNITIFGPGSKSLTIQRSTAAGTGNFSILSFAPINGNFSNFVTGFTLSNGNATAGTFPGNSGGALMNFSSCTTDMSDVVINTSVATQGGGVYNGGTLNLSGVSVIGNSSTNGGGIYNTGTLTAINSTVASNVATGGSGGGIFTNSMLTINQSLISNNGATAGGGIYSVGNASITNSTISTNNASSEGGGINNAGPLTLNNATIADNTATTQGGGMYNPGIGAGTINNSILAANTSPSGPDCSCANLSGDYNLYSNSSGATIPGTHNVTNTGALLGPLANNGGSTKTHALLVGSPAIDAGNSAQMIDQRSQPRPVDDPTVTNAATSNATDMGAYESHNLEVNTVVDADDGACTLLVTGNGCTLREAINAANVQMGAEVISFAPALTSGGPATINLSSALPNLSSSMTINGPGSGLLTVRRDTGGDYRIFHITFGTVGISGLTVANGKTADGGTGFSCASAGASGGGILNAGTLTLTDVNLTGNRTGAGGAAINNGGFGGCGGALANIGNSANVTMTDCDVTGNITGNGGAGNNLVGDGGWGGGIYNENNLTMTDCSVNGNTTGDSGTTAGVGGQGGPGGGIYSRVGVLTLTSVTVNNNVTGSVPAVNGGGGGGTGGGITLIIGIATLTNCTISGNQTGTMSGGPARGHGGGIYSQTPLTMTGSTISNNTGDVAALYTRRPLVITNSTFSGNHSVGIFNDNSSLSLTNSTITANDGVGVSDGGPTSEVRNTIIAGNGTFGSPDVSGTFNTQGNNLIGVNGSGFFGPSGFTDGVNNDKVGTSANPLNARLAALGNYGGLTQTHALLPGSPALDAGNNCVNQSAHCGDANIPQLTTDQRGLNRVINSTVDIGAFESRGFTVSATSGSPQTATMGSAFALPLVATISSSFAEPVANGVITFSAPTSGASGTFSGGVTSVTASANGSGVATSPTFTANLIQGSYNVSAGSSGIPVSAAFSLTNAKAGSSTSVSSSANPSSFGDNVTFTATITAGVSLTPTGTVQFKDGVSNIGSTVTCVAGPGNTCTAQFSISTLSVGNHNISATYSGDTNFDTSTGSLAGGQLVNCVATVVSNTNDSGAGSLRHAILGACPGGTITFAAGLTSGGPATITLTSGELLIDKNLTINGPGANLLSVSGNHASRIFNVQTGNVVITGLAIFDGEVGLGQVGGGIWNRSSLSLINCAVIGNSSPLAGGGISNDAENGPATLTIINSTISGNKGNSFGSGIFNSGTHGATVNLINSTVTGNSAVSLGGGIYNSASSGPATLNVTNSTIAGNSAASQGGGIYNFGNNGAGTVNLNNSIVADNVAPAGNGPDISNSFGNLSGSNNIIENSGEHTITGSNNSNVDPLLEKDGTGNVILKSNGGPTKTLLPAHNSPAINSGSNAALPTDAVDLDGDANTSEALPVDQRGPGFARIVNTTVDIGAVETNYTITPIAGSPQGALVNTTFATQLQARVQESGINLSGFAVTFTAPASGATGSFSGSATVNTDASGIATAPVFTANGTAGGYNVVASLVGGSPSANFALANLSTLSINDVSITEGNSATANLTFTVTLAATSNLTVTVNYATANGTATTADSDYQSTSGTLTFNPGDLTKTVTVVVNGDQKTEPDETVFVVLSNPVNAAFSDSQGQGTILNDDTLQLLLDTSGPDPNQLAALDSLLLIRDPFRVQNAATWFTSETNTRVILFALNLQLNSGESPSVVKVMLVDGNGGTHEVAADDVRTMPNTTFTQVTFRLPDGLTPGTCSVSIKAHNRISDTGTFRIAP